MNGSVAALVQALALVAGSALILLLFALLATRASALINPRPPTPAGERERDEVDRFERRRELDEATAAQRDPDRDSMDSTPASVRAFAIAWLVLAPSAAWLAVSAHAAAPGGGVPVAAVWGLVWMPAAGALVVGLLVGAVYRRWWRGLSPRRRREVVRRRAAKAERERRGRPRAIGGAARPGRRDRSY